MGSRMGPTVTLARDVLGSLNAFTEAHASSCPLASAPPELKKTEAYAAGEALATARANLLRDLHQLAVYAAGCGSESCCAEAKAAGAKGETALTNAPSPKGDAAACPKELAARVSSLKASWATVGDDLAKLPAAKVEEIRTGFGSLAKSCKAVSLLPPSVATLSEGFDALDALQGKLGEWAQANPAFMKSISEEAKKACEEQLALVRETGAILRRAAETLKAGESANGSPPTAGGTAATKS